VGSKIKKRMAVESLSIYGVICLYRTRKQHQHNMWHEQNSWRAFHIHVRLKHLKQKDTISRVLRIGW
jgi:hypothetical protein